MAKSFALDWSCRWFCKKTSCRWSVDLSNNRIQWETMDKDIGQYLQLSGWLHSNTRNHNELQIMYLELESSNVSRMETAQCHNKILLCSDLFKVFYVRLYGVQRAPARIVKKASDLPQRHHLVFLPHSIVLTYPHPPHQIQTRVHRNRHFHPTPWSRAQRLTNFLLAAVPKQLQLLEISMLQLDELGATKRWKNTLFQIGTEEARNNANIF